MEIQVLGAHNLESSTSRLVSLFLDETVVLDAGSLTRALSLSKQAKVKAILLTHQHFDHIRDIATYGLASAGVRTTPVYATPSVLQTLSTDLINGELYPEFTRWPSPEKPTFKFFPVEPCQPFTVAGYKVLPLPVPHSHDAVGYEVKTEDNKCLFYTGDTGSGLANCWQKTSPQLLITEVSGPDREEKRMREASHLTPSLLKKELLEFRRLKGYFPTVLLLHLNPRWRKDTEEETARLAKELSINITVAHDGLKFSF